MRLILLLALAAAALAQDIDAGRREFFGRCVGCHGADAAGGEFGPSILDRLPQLNDSQLSETIRNGRPASGMPAFPLTDFEMSGIVAFLRTLRSTDASESISVTLTNGQMLRGEVLNRTRADLQLRTADGRIALLRAEGERYRRVTSEVDWPGYNGDPGGNRYSSLDQINAANVSRLAPAWVFAQRGAGNLQVTPVVVDGIMYVTNVNECFALDAGTGRELWHFRRPRTQGLLGSAGGGINRGVAVAGDRLFLVTDHAHLLALNRFTGSLLWDSEMADYRQNYGATGAPLVVGDLVLSGVGGGGQGARGFIAAYQHATGEEVWRTWTVPLPGEPGSETWGEGIDHPSAPTWMTGTHDPELGLVYWPTGNPGPDFNGDRRPGDNLYSDSILALDDKTGRMKWYFQFTPHDVWDWDATEPPVLVDADWQGRPRKLLLQANRNGFFYVLDRTDGELLLAKQFVDKLTWAAGLDESGRPILNPDTEPTEDGRLICPSVEGATNWFSTAYDPGAGLYYVQTTEDCNIYIKREMEWRAGASYRGGATRSFAEGKPRKILRAIDIGTGESRWQFPQVGPADSWGGTLATAGGIVIFGEDGGAFTAVDAASGEHLWSYQTNSVWKASPMTYQFDGKQYIAVAAGPVVLAFALPD